MTTTVEMSTTAERGNSLNRAVSAKLDSWKRDTGTTDAQICDALGISASSLRRRRTGASEWRVSEVFKLCGLMGCTASEIIR